MVLGDASLPILVRISERLSKRPHIGGHPVSLGGPLAARVGLGVRLVLVPVLEVTCRELRVTDDEEVLGVLLLRGLGEIKRARDHGGVVDDDDLIVRYCVRFVDERCDLAVCEEIGLRVFFSLLRPIQYRRDLDAAPLGLDEGFGDGGGCEGVCLNVDGFLRRVDFPDACVGGAAIRGEVNLNALRLECLLGAEWSCDKRKESDEARHA